MTNDKDNNDDEKKENKSESSSFWLFAIIGIVFAAIFKYPKVMIPVLLVAGLLFGSFLCFGDTEYESDAEKTEQRENSKSLHRAMGSRFDQKKYAAAKVYEPLAEGYGNELPSKYSLLKYAPKRKNQGDQGSCTGWAVSYAARTILQAKLTGENPDEIAFSPAYLFNQNTDAKCNGAYPSDLLEDLKKEGNLPYEEFPYNENSCRKKPNASHKEMAKAYKIDGYQRLTVDGEDYDTDVNSVKQYLSHGAPVIISMNVGGSFNEFGGKVWIPKFADYESAKKYKASGGNEPEDWGGHAMTAIGYDDDLEGGAVQVMNSWGMDWGDQGTFWLRYEDFNQFIREAYSVYPIAKPKANDVRNLKFGLVENTSKKFIKLTKVGEFTYRTTNPILKGTRFKVAVTNEAPTYVYIFGQETDNSSYVLFPYNKSHSPYCGPGGVRTFPRKQSLEADRIGERDSIAVVLSSKNLDYENLNSKINQMNGKTYSEKLKQAFSGSISTKVTLGEGGDYIELASKETQLDKMSILVIEFDKK